MKRLVADLAKGEPIEAAVAVAKKPDTVATYFEAWIARRRAEGIVSARDEASWLNTWALPHIGPLPLGAVRPVHLTAVIDAGVDGGLSHQSLLNLRGAMNRMFKSAWRSEIIERNPVEKVVVPKLREAKKERAILTDYELSILLDYPDGDVELKILAVVARTLGGARTGDLNKLA